MFVLPLPVSFPPSSFSVYWCRRGAYTTRQTKLCCLFCLFFSLFYYYYIFTVPLTNHAFSLLTGAFKVTKMHYLSFSFSLFMVSVFLRVWHFFCCSSVSV